MKTQLSPEIEKLIEEKSLEYQIEHLKSEVDEYGNENKKQLDSYWQAYSKGAREFYAQAWKDASEYLMNNAGNYCNCKNAYGDQCDKHAQTFSASILQDEAKHRGIDV